MLSRSLDWLVFSLLGLSGRLGEVLKFFLYDTIKILFLIFVLIFFVGVLRTYVSEDRLKKLFSMRYGIGNLFASLFGAITPFCSCSSIPVFIGMIKARLNLGVALSFLITSPLVNEYLVVLMLAFFGLKITIIYVVSGILIGTISGIILGSLRLERFIDPEIKGDTPNKVFLNFKERLNFGLEESRSIVKKIWLWVILGVGVGAVIHNLVPQEAVENIIGATGILSVPIAVVIGVPLYANCAAIVPVAVALFEKGIPLGTTIAFMMSSSALSFPEAVILRRAMKLRLIAIFFGTVALGIILVGYIVNIIS